MAERFDPDPNDFYALLDDIEMAVREAQHIRDNEREKIIARVREIRRKSNDATDENLIKWDSSLRGCLNNMGDPNEQAETIIQLLESDRENIGDLQKCLDQIRQEMGSNLP